MKGKNVGWIHEKVGTKILALGITGDFRKIGLQFVLAGAPGKIGIGLGEAELRKRLHYLGPGESLRQKDHVRIDDLDLPDQPFPERKGLGVRVVDAKDAHSLRHPE